MSRDRTANERRPIYIPDDQMEAGIWALNTFLDTYKDLLDYQKEWRSVRCLKNRMMKEARQRNRCLTKKKITFEHIELRKVNNELQSKKDPQPIQRD